MTGWSLLKGKAGTILITVLARHSDFADRAGRRPDSTSHMLV